MSTRIQPLVPDRSPISTSDDRPLTRMRLEVLAFHPLDVCLGVRLPASDGILVVRVAGDLDAATATDFRRALRAALDHTDEAVVVDFGGIDFLAVCGAHVLASEWVYAQTRPVGLVLVPGSRPAAHTLAATGLRDRFECFPSTQAAIDTVRRRRGDRRPPVAG